MANPSTRLDCYKAEAVFYNKYSNYIKILIMDNVRKKVSKTEKDNNNKNAFSSAFIMCEVLVISILNRSEETDGKSHTLLLHL